ncbi:MAG: hypothetical protein JNJ75_10920 [Cyclobacteriaceae bacterium]|nr:hypothetical protein [Cyclobacteriaceae bacterium]
MLIQEKLLKHWMDYFYGYGSWNAKAWFVAFEESGGDLPEDVAERLNYFTSVHREKIAALCDIRELYRKVGARLEGPRAAKFTTLYDHRFGPQSVQHGGWKNLIAFTFGFRGKELPDLAKYQRQKFLQPSLGSEALVTLYPLPAPHNHAWYYSWLDIPAFSFLKSRKGYQETVYEKRIQIILQHIKKHSPEVVVMYGMTNILELKKSVLQVFPGVAFKTVKAVNLHTPQYHVTEVNGTKLIITTQVPTLRHNRIETGYDWYAFGKEVQ